MRSARAVLLALLAVALLVDVLVLAPHQRAVGAQPTRARVADTFWWPEEWSRDWYKQFFGMKQPAVPGSRGDDDDEDERE